MLPWETLISNVKAMNQDKGGIPPVEQNSTFAGKQMTRQGQEPMLGEMPMSELTRYQIEFYDTLHSKLKATTRYTAN